MMRTKKFHTPLLSVVLLFGLLLVLACGKKGPPLPPLVEGKAVAPPVNLAYTTNESQVTISWTHAVGPKAEIEPEGFAVFVATKDASGCEGCPFIFEPAGTVGMPEMSFQYTMKEGLDYYFRVQALGGNNLKSKFSETLYIDVQ